MFSKLAFIILIIFGQVNFSSGFDVSKVTQLFLSQGKVLSSNIKREIIQGLAEIKPAPLVRRNGIEDPEVQAKSAIIFDVSTNQILFEKNARTRYPIASLTKIMTGALILESGNLNDIVRITPEMITGEDVNVGLRVGEEIKVRDLLYALLLKSSNDAARALAIHQSGLIENFVELMNKKAQILGLEDTHFTNPSGLDEKKQIGYRLSLDNSQELKLTNKIEKSTDNYSTAYDLIKLTNWALSKNLFSKIIATREIKIKSQDGEITHNLKNTNRLIRPRFPAEKYIPPKGVKVLGGKTGFIDDAGYCLLTVTEKDSHKIIYVILNSETRFPETKKLIKWTTEAYN